MLITIYHQCLYCHVHHFQLWQFPLLFQLKISKAWKISCKNIRIRAKSGKDNFFLNSIKMQSSWITGTATTGICNCHKFYYLLKKKYQIRKNSSWNEIEIKNKSWKSNIFKHSIRKQTRERKQFSPKWH